MSTLLLVSGENGSEAPSAAAPRRGPSLKASLERVGYEVVQVKDGAAALSRVGQERPDLIVLAGTVPDMELVDLCTAIRRDPVVEKVPFVLVADPGARNGGAASRAGADLVFPASVGPVEIADRLRRLF